MDANTRGSERRCRTRARWGLLWLGPLAFVPLAYGVTFTVTTTNDAGPGSLREAIEKSNQTGGADRNTIAFNITEGVGPYTIKPLSALPPATHPVSIDGYTQPGARVNTDASGSNAVLQIVLTGSASSGGSGLTIEAGGSSVRGLAINEWYESGITLAGNGGIVVAGNFIGTDASGLTAKGNGTGVSIQAGSSSNYIGEPDPQSRNVISGNRGEGIQIIRADRTKIAGNLIGTDKTGGAKLGNAKSGIYMLLAKGTSVGESSLAHRNVISANAGSGIFSQGGSEGLILGNYIGTDAGGTAALGNGLAGVSLSDVEGEGGSNVVGQTAAGAANLIANNGHGGVEVLGSGSIGNSIRGNGIYRNQGLGIDLELLGVTPNDPAPDQDKGANRLQNFPDLTGIEASGAGIKVSGVFQSVPNTLFHIDFYANEVRDPSGHGEGQFYLGTVDVTTDGKGEVVFEATLPAPAGPWISATATRAGDVPDTSEFSPVIARAGTEYGVNTTNATGLGSFAQAVQDSNATGNPSVVNRIRFAIPGAGSHVITPASTIAATQPVIIDGYTQPGATAPTPVIGLDGIAVAGPVLNVSGNNVTVRGLAFLHHQPASNIGAVQVTGNGNWLIGNLFGVTPGNSVNSNRIGIGVFGEDNRIGGPDATDRNVISGNTVAGIALGTGAKRTLVQGNLIGTDSTGAQDRGNGDSGISVSSAGQSRIVGNVIAFNGQRGVFVGGTAAGNTLSRNSMFGNKAGMGIDLSPAGPDTNDAGDADARANGGQNHPELANATIVGSVTVTGAVNSAPDGEFTLEFFISPSCSPTGFGEGRTYLGATVATTDATGTGAFSFTLPDNVAAGQSITATATDAAGNTSEFSRCMAIAGGPPPAGTVVSLLSPKEATNATGTTHSVTATLASGSAPLSNVPVTFTVVSGPNSDRSGTVATDGSGKATFSYASDGTAGTDEIAVAGVAAGVQFASSAKVTWSASGSAAVVEYYNALLDHYFITWIPTEIAILDAGVQIKGWVRTGYTLRTYTAAHAGTSPVCRFYIPPELGDSHFFGRGTAECDATAQKNPSIVLEDPQYMRMFLPSLGACPAGTTNVYRVFSNRADANHRYTTDRALRDQMVAKGWLAEGDGSDLVVMCAPL